MSVKPPDRPGAIGPLAIAAAALFAALPATGRADEAFARQRLGEMSAYLGAQEVFSFEYDASLDIVTAEGQLLTIASSGASAMERPDRLSASRQGGFASVGFSFDGTTLTVINKDENVFARADVPGSVEHLIDELRDTYHRPLPAADLLLPDVAGALEPLFTDVKDLGSGVIGGVECDHLAFRTDGADLQLWIAHGDPPYPCRYSVSSTEVEGSPQYVVTIRDWKTGAEAMAATAIEIPADAREVAANEVPDLDDLAGIYAVEGAN
jgi:hypothetical protein